MSSSWFNMEKLQDLADKASASVQSHVPKFDKDMLEKLTLTTPELTAERQRLDAEERHKAEIKNMLAGLLPWETRDPERDILVEECREAILQLSADKETFFGPYPMPPKAVKLERSKKKKVTTEEGDNVEGGEGVEEEETGVKTVEEAAAEEESHEHHRHNPHPPSPESLEKLKKLEPLPPLLHDFDLDAHVGLIQKLLEVDPKLVEMQMHLSGGGEREKTFWRNYFFHCAYTRYEAGLSPDEIWAEDAQRAAADAAAAAGTEETTKAVEATTEEETVTFEKMENAPPPAKAFPGGDPTTSNEEEKVASSTIKDKKDAPSSVSTSNSVNTQDYEMVTSTKSEEEAVEDAAAAANEEDVADYELDELEAEIARELED